MNQKPKSISDSIVEAANAPCPEVVELRKLVAATRQAAAASLAGGIIAASGRVQSMADAMTVYNDSYYTLFPDPDTGRYTDWKAKHDPNKTIG